MSAPDVSHDDHTGRKLSNVSDADQGDAEQDDDGDYSMTEERDGPGSPEEGHELAAEEAHAAETTAQ